MVKISCAAATARPLWILRNNGLWPVKRFNTSTALKFLFNIIFDITTFSVVSHNILIAIRTKDIKLLNWMTCVIFPLTNLFAKTISPWIRKEKFLSAVNDLSSDAFNTHTEELNRHIQTIDKISKLILRYFAIVMTMFMSIFCVLPIFTNMPPMVPAPFDTGKYDVIYKLIHLFCTSYLAANSACIDVFYMSLIALCVAQLNILEEKLTNVYQNAQEVCKGCEDNIDATAENILKECVILHEDINIFVKKLGAILSFPLFLQYAYGCFVICNTILQLTILGTLQGEKDSTIIGLCCYSGIVTAQMSAYHWFGNEVIVKSNKIIEACLVSEWYKLNIKCQKYLLILMERAKRSLVISLYELVFVSLESLGVVVRWSYSLFALIKARYD